MQNRLQQFKQLQSNVARQRAVLAARRIPKANPNAVLLAARRIHPMANQRANPQAVFAPQQPYFRPVTRYAYNEFGFSLKKVFKNVGKAVTKATKDIGHVTGKVVTSKIGKVIIGGGLALTGVGIPAAAGIMSVTQAGGQLIKPGGNLRKAGKGAIEGGVEGAVAGVAGKALGKLGGVQKLRQKIGRGPKPILRSASDDQLDALASGKIPDVGVTPSLSAAKPDIIASIDRAEVVRDAAKRRGARAAQDAVTQAVDYERQAGALTAEANAATDPSLAERLRRRARDLMKKAEDAKAVGEAAQAIAGTVSGSANPIAPQGGYSVPDNGAESTVVAPGEASVVGLPTPVLIGAAAVALFMFSGRRR